MLAERSFIDESLGVGAAALLAARHRLELRGWLDGSDGPPDVIRDTYNALLTFVVPERARTSEEPQTLDQPACEAIDALIAALDSAAPYCPNFAAFLAAVLNNIALGVNARAGGPSPSPFARLSLREQGWVFQFMGTDDAMREMSTVLPGCVAYLAHNQRQHSLLG